MAFTGLGRSSLHGGEEAEGVYTVQTRDQASVSLEATGNAALGLWVSPLSLAQGGCFQDRAVQPEPLTHQGSVTRTYLLRNFLLHGNILPATDIVSPSELSGYEHCGLSLQQRSCASIGYSSPKARRSRGPLCPLGCPIPALGGCQEPPVTPLSLQVPCGGSSCLPRRALRLALCGSD